MLARFFSVCIIAVMWIEYTQCGGHSAFLDGGADGEDGSHHLNGTPNTEKLVTGLFCSKPNSTSTTLEMTIYVYAKDNLTHTDGPNINTLVTWEQCQFVNVAAFRTGTKSRQTGAGCNLTRLDNDLGPDGVSAGDIDENTLGTKLSFPTTSAAPCGGLQVGPAAFTFVVECYRNEQFQKHFDVYYEYTCDGGTALSRTLTNSTLVGDPRVVNVTNRYKVDMNVYKVTDLARLADPIEKTVEVAGGIEIPSVAGVSLGDSFILEWCIAIDTANGDSRWFFGDNDVKGIHIESLTIENVESENAIAPGFVRTVEVLKENCGLGLEPAPQFLNDSIPDIIYRRVAGVTKDYLTSPNCFRSRIFEVSRFVNSQIGLAKIRITAELSYCNTINPDTNGINICFGNLTSSDLYDGYTDCSGVSGRRKRAIEENDMPESLSVTININNGGKEDPDNNQQDGETIDEAKTEKCLEKDTFTILTACLSFLLAVVVMMSVFLACKIQTVRRDEKEISQSGFTNKGYY